MSNVKFAQPSKLVELRIASKYSLVGLEHENVCHTSLKIVKWLVRVGGFISHFCSQRPFLVLPVVQTPRVWSHDVYQRMGTLKRECVRRARARATSTGVNAQISRIF